MASKTPNIVLIVLDTVGAKHLSLYGYQRPTSPYLEQIAEASTLYTRCFAPGCWTLPTHASMFTGLYPGEHKAFGTNYILDANLQHLVTILKHAGYKTYGFSSNGWVSPLTGVCRDFDLFADYGSIVALTMNDKGDPKRRAFLKQMQERPPSWEKLRYLAFEGLKHGYSDILWSYGINVVKKFLMGGPASQNSHRYTNRSFRGATKLLKQHSSTDSPFFLFFNFMDGHSLYSPPYQDRHFSRLQDRQTIQSYCLYAEEYIPLREQLLAVWQNLYDDAIISVDRAVYRFWQDLQNLGLRHNTIFMVTGDHGEHFGEKGHYEHHFSLYNEDILVPLLISFPKSIRAPGTDDRLVSLNDIFSTLLEVCNSPYPQPHSSESVLSASPRASLSSMILGGKARKERLRMQLKQSKAWENQLPLCSYALVLAEGLKIIEQHDGRLEIYNLAVDPGEATDLAPRLEPEMLQELASLLYLDQQQTGYDKTKTLASEEELLPLEFLAL
ncbi:MAG: sulfatase [Desulfobacteraceae bacterium]